MINRQSQGKTDIQREGETDRHQDGQIDIRMERQTIRQTDRQTDEFEIQIETERQAASLFFDLLY